MAHTRGLFSNHKIRLFILNTCIHVDFYKFSEYIICTIPVASTSVNLIIDKKIMNYLLECVRSEEN